MLNIGELSSQDVIKLQMGLSLVTLILLTMSQIWGFFFHGIVRDSVQANPGQAIHYGIQLLLRYFEVALNFVLYFAVQKKSITLFRIWSWTISGNWVISTITFAANEYFNKTEIDSQHPQEFGNPLMVTSVLFIYIWGFRFTVDILVFPTHIMELLSSLDGKEKRSWARFQFTPFKRYLLIQGLVYLLPIALYFFVYMYKIVKYLVKNRQDYDLLGVYIFGTFITPMTFATVLFFFKGLKQKKVSELIRFYKLHIVVLYLFGVTSFLRRILENRSQATASNSFIALVYNLIVAYYATNYHLLNNFLMELIIQLQLAKMLPQSLLDTQKPDQAEPCRWFVAKKFVQKITIPQNQIQICETDKLGEGQFGVVYKALKYPAQSVHISYFKICFPPKKSSPEVVAVKVLKHNSDDMYAGALLNELKILDGVGKHENLLNFFGCCVLDKTSKGQKEIAMVLEYCSLGNLQTYVSSLADSKMYMDIFKLFRFSFEISEGMSYLESRKVIHADLAARNVLLDANQRIKITDFGMSLQLYYYQTITSSKADLFPWKTTAPEALTDLKFSSKSDVWSYGIVLFEIFSLGADPYPGLSWTSQIVQQILAGLRPQKPKLGGDAVHEIISHCLQLDPGRRPGFKELSMRFDRLRNDGTSLNTSI